MSDFNIARIRYNWKSQWTGSTDYINDDIVYYGGKAYVCASTHTSNNSFVTDLNSNIWILMFDGYVWRGNWTSSTLYNPGDSVKYDGIVYRCLVSHTSASFTSPTYLGLENDQSKWAILAKVENYKGNWTTDTRYKVDDLVKYGATVYRCNTAHISTTNPSLGLENDQSKWTTVYQQIEYKSNWTVSTKYKVNDVVKVDGSLWRCIAGHISVSSAGSIGSDLQSYWLIYLDGLEHTYSNWSSGAVYRQGDVVTYGGYSYRALTTNTAQVPSTSVLYWELITQNYKFLGNWDNVTNYFVGDTVRLNGYVYTCIKDGVNFEPPNPTYWTAIIPGRSWKNAWSAAISYKLGDIVTYKATSYECKLAHTSAVGNRPDTDVAGSGTYWITFIEGNTSNVLTTQGDIVWYNNSGKDRLGIGAEGQVLKVVGSNLTWASFGIINKVYYVSPNGVDSPTGGTTLNTPFRTIKYACAIVTGPATIFIKSGLYSEILPISIPANVSLVGDELRSTVIRPAAGYETSNMFYMRNGADLRNCTLQGLSGSLGTANVYGTKRPTAGAYVSLDPGAGPSDSSTWITSKSPYVQNVTTFGDGCTGLKIDATLHNGGNKSIVANDFTQVLNDGIGVWIKGVGRSECVSVFTYYCYIGYLTEDGGKLRATNGNNSYGSYGAVSEGVDAGEVPVTALVNNRFNQATVGNVITDTSQVLALEFNNAGINYSSSPTITISGTGTGANIESYNLRTGGVYEVRITDPTNTGFPGGTSYLNVTGFAQGGSSVGTIILPASDTNTQSNYIGMRVVVISGVGAGQYGYISSYDNTTKTAQIYKETTGTQGWDHINAGTTIVNLDASTQFSIEPRITVAPPPFSSSLSTLPLTANWSGITYGGGRYVVIDGISTITINSTDGSAWSAGSGLANLGANSSIAYGTNTFIAIGTTGTTVSRSTNGTSWSSTTRPGGTGSNSKLIRTVGNRVSLILSGAPSRTNLVTYSNNFTNLSWTTVEASVQSTTLTRDPANGTSVVKLVESTANNQHLTSVNLGVVSNGAIYTISLFAKAAERTQISLTGFGEGYSVFNLSNGTVSQTGGNTCSINPVGNTGWYRISATVTKTNTNGSFYILIWNGSNLYTGDGASGLYIYGAQIELGSRMSGYIPTSGGTGTATAELLVTADAQTWYTLGTPAVTGGAWAYGKGIYVTLASGTSNTASYSFNGVVWTSTTLPASSTWTSVSFGNDRFVAIASGTNSGAYSFDGITWTAMTMPSNTTWSSIYYDQGIFFAVATATSTAATSPNGINWTSRTLPTAATWSDLTFGNPSSPGKWIVIANGSSSAAAINAGATPFVRASIVSGSIRSIRVIDPGSSYSSSPTLTVTDPNSTGAVSYTARIGNNVLAQPNYISRGSSYILASATITDSSGFADSYQTGFNIQVQNMTNLPTVGSNITFAGNPTFYKLLALSNITGSVGNYSARLQLDTNMTAFRSPNDGSSLSIRINYSQCRLTGHDFLSIGTGGFISTNYPDTPLQNSLSTVQAVEYGGGRVFFTSTDQDGNFLAGGLFGVSQATGIVTLSAALFNLSGLNQISLGALVVGSTSAIINTISTDGTMSANSDNVISTQKAIATYLNTRIGGGGTNTTVSSAQAGYVKLSSSDIENVTGSQITINAKSNFTGGIDGVLLASTYFNTAK